MKGRQGISGQELKVIAIVTMIIDHIGAVLLEAHMLLPWCEVNGYSYTDLPFLDLLNVMPPDMQRLFLINAVCRGIGRMAFPIFCFLIVEGFSHTRRFSHYVFRLLFFAAISEVPFDLAIFGKTVDWQGQNVFFTLTLGLLAIALVNAVQTHLAERQTPHWVSAFAAVVALPMAFFAEWAHTDYGAFGVLLITLLFISRSERALQTFIGAFAVAIEITAAFAFIFIWRYNGQRGRGSKWLFYLIYPLQFLVLAGVRACL